MRRLGMTALSLLVVVGLAVGLAPAAAGEITVKAEIVAVDTDSKTITFQDQEGVERTLPVEAEAAQAFQSLTSGDTVTLTCRTSEDGKLVAITAIAKT